MPSLRDECQIVVNWGNEGVRLGWCTSFGAVYNINTSWPDVLSHRCTLCYEEAPMSGGIAQKPVAYTIPNRGTYSTCSYMKLCRRCSSILYDCTERRKKEKDRYKWLYTFAGIGQTYDEIIQSVQSNYGIEVWDVDRQRWYAEWEALFLQKVMEQMAPIIGLPMPIPDDWDCAVCADSDEAAVINTRCGHHFHASCLYWCMKTDLRCPYCRQDL